MKGIINMLSIRKIFCTVLAFMLTLNAFSCFALTQENIYVPNLPVWDGSIAENYAGGDGTKDNPYLISNGSQLALLMKEINETSKEAEQTTAGEYYKLTNDIVLNKIHDFNDWNKNAPENEWIPGGAVVNYTPKGFAGYFDGNNYDIFGLYISNDNQYNGLFGYVYNGQIKNLGIKYAYVKGGNNSAILAGYARASSSAVYFSGCKLEHIYLEGKNNVGAVVGYPESYNKKLFIDKCSVSGEVSGNNYVGGIAGLAVAYGVKYNNDDNYAISITNCINNGIVSGRNGIGGIVGSSKDFVSAVGKSGNIALLIENCVNNGEIFAKTEHIGAIIGTAGPADREDKSVITHINNCYGNSEYTKAVYGYTLAETDASTSKLYTESQMSGKNNFKDYNFEKIWDIVNYVPALRILGDIKGNGKVTQEDIAAMISYLATNDGEDLELANIDFNGDGEYTSEDLNLFVRYVKNKGASANISPGSVRIVKDSEKSKNGNEITYSANVFNPKSGREETGILAYSIYGLGDIVSYRQELVDIADRVFGNIYTKGEILDLNAEKPTGLGYVEVESYDSETGILKLKGYDEEFKVGSHSEITFSDKSFETFKVEEADKLGTTNKAYHQNDNPANPIRVFVCANKTSNNTYNVVFAVIVRD